MTPRPLLMPMPDRTGRRRLLGALLALPWLGTAGCARAQIRPVEQLVSSTTLLAQLAKRFPYTQKIAGDLVTLELRDPRLRMLPDVNRVATVVALTLSSPLLGTGLGIPGSLAVDWRPRYEPADHTIRMADVLVRSVQLDGVPAEYAAWLDRNAPRLADKLLDGQLLYTLTPRDTAALAAFGWQLGGFTVVPQGLKVRLDPLRR